MEKKYCKFCGAEMDSNETYCPKCGKSQNTANVNNKPSNVTSPTGNHIASIALSVVSFSFSIFSALCLISYFTYGTFQSTVSCGAISLISAIVGLVIKDKDANRWQKAFFIAALIVAGLSIATIIVISALVGSGLIKFSWSNSCVCK
jgi:hypothetical protein